MNNRIRELSSLTSVTETHCGILVLREDNKILHAVGQGATISQDDIGNLIQELSKMGIKDYRIVPLEPTGWKKYLDTMMSGAWLKDGGMWWTGEGTTRN